jgi:hypothetical protein
MIWLKAGIVIAVILVIGVGLLYERKRAYNEGVSAERLSWQEDRNRMLLKHITDFKAETQRRNEIEEGLLAQLTDKEQVITSLDAALEQEKTDAKNDPPGTCRAAMPRRLRDQLNDIN